MLAMAWLIAIDGPIAGIVGFAVLAACGSAFFYPTIGAYIPNLVRDERELGPANGAWASLDNLGYVVGPAIGGLLVAGGGAVFALLINAATFAVIAAILWRLPPSPNATRAATSTAPGEAGPPSAAPPQPLSPRVPRRPIAGLLLMTFAMYAFDAGVGILTVVLAIDVLGAGDAGTGYLNAAVGVGGILGALTSGVLILRRRLAPPLVAGALVSSVALAVLSVAGVLPVAFLGVAMFSLGYYVVDVAVTTIIQRILPDAARGRGIGLLMSVGTLGEMVGSIAVPVIVGAAGVAILGPASLLLLAAVAVGVVLVGTNATREPTAAEETLARVSRQPLFSGVPPDRLEVALRRLVTTPVVAGQAIVSEGDPADRFYIIQSGSFSVTRRDVDAEERQIRTLGPDGVFGELGLLTGAPRSATVTAASDGTLLALDGPEFLELVGGGGALRGRLLGLYASTPAR
jgi:MFS family permease